ncbi:heavy metal RND transporter [Lelliottia sp. F153]|uniref:TolC family protein n=1 Tax=unclassified Lelliottia TaxID=2642424 RepID=UPI000C7F72DF|nr:MULTISPECIES: TolC family protein [unclassified Lelliottia]PLY46470.1 heavy metal RND transporter [Lelliottia sp. F159]PLY50731.1 heavy metal RND transporter [Lelliottia sp. F154]PLY56393.1 heavy metal RND transporter [Lelliottia sp. F153]
MKYQTLSLWLGGVLLGFLSSAVQAQSWTLAQTLTEAQRYSAELSASRNEAQALDMMADSATQLPDPKLKFGIENVPVQGSNDQRFSREGMTMQRIGVMQSYVSAEKRERKSQTLQAQARGVEAKSEAIRAALQRDTAQAWLDLALSKQALTTAKNLVSETERQQGVQKASVGAGSASPDSVLSLQMTLSAMRDKVTLASRDVQLAQSRLFQLTGQAITDVQGPLPRYQRLPADEKTLEEAIVRHPEVEAAQRESETAKARSAQSAIAAIPDVDVEVFYAHRAEGYDDMAGVMFTVDLPLFQSRRQDKDYAAEVSRSMQAVDQLTLIQREHVAQVQSLVAQYQAAQTLWQRQRDDLLPLQHQRLAVLAAQYRSGQSELPALLEARRSVLDTELAANQAEREMARTWAAIQWLIPQDITQ